MLIDVFYQKALAAKRSLPPKTRTFFVDGCPAVVITLSERLL